MAPRQNTLVRFIWEAVTEDYRDKYPFNPGDSYIYLGEIVNMPGHCIVADKAGRVYYGYHVENFVELTEDEV